MPQFIVKLCGTILTSCVPFLPAYGFFSVIPWIKTFENTTVRFLIFSGTFLPALLLFVVGSILSVLFVYETWKRT